MQEREMRLVFIVEGQTEVEFVERVLIKHLYTCLQAQGISRPWAMNAQAILTNRQQNKKGGGSSYNLLKKNIITTSKQGSVLITTLIDFFRLPTDCPGYTQNSSQVNIIEQEILKDIPLPANGFYPYIQRHEIESLMYSDIVGFERAFGTSNQRVIQAFQNIIGKYPNPEDINGGHTTSPSKRILGIVPKYKKVTDGAMILEELGIDTIMKKCPRFRSWVSILEGALQNGHF